MATHRVLGISLGTRKMGLAVLDRYSIFDCCVKSFPGPWSGEKKRAIVAVITEYIEVYRIAQVWVKMPTLGVDAPAVAELLAQIEQLATGRNITFHTCTMGELKERLGLNTRANKQALMSVVLKRFPELLQEYERARKSKVKHYEKLFEAVGTAGTFRL